MNIAVVSHTPIDTIEGKEMKLTTVGGPTSYAGATAKALGFKVDLITKIGLDFPAEFRHILLENGLTIPKEAVSAKSPTTHFRLVLRDHDRDLFLLARCDDLTTDDVVDASACVVSPVINEVNGKVLEQIRRRTAFLFLDPQGFVRSVDSAKKCYIARTELPRISIDAMKADEEEAYALTGMRGREALKKLRAGTAILTNKNKTTMLHSGYFYEIETELIDAQDSTGVGDIFAAAYACSFAKESDARWALCNAVAASVTALRSGARGLAKIPAKGKTDSYASALHEGLKGTPP